MSTFQWIQMNTNRGRSIQAMSALYTGLNNVWAFLSSLSQLNTFIAWELLFTFGKIFKFSLYCRLIICCWIQFYVAFWRFFFIALVPLVPLYDHWLEQSVFLKCFLKFVGEGKRWRRSHLSFFSSKMFILTCPTFRGFRCSQWISG